MKLHSTKSEFLNTFTSYGDGFVEINEVRYEHSVIVRPEGKIERWEVSSVAEINADHFRQLLKDPPELVLFGSGRTLRFVHPGLHALLTERQIGVETMDMRAACRTYNILISEGRKVVAALLVEPSLDH